MQTAPAFGLIIIGSEILDGRVVDCHQENLRKLLSKKHLNLIYSLVIADEPELIEETLHWAFKRPEPFFSCGGIGATPDDYTRKCSANVKGLEIEVHPDGEKIMQDRSGKTMSKTAFDLIRFPAGSGIIPNPINQVPGYTLSHGHFVPGFPSMAQPMMAWVLENLYLPGKEQISISLLVPGGSEGRLIPLMEAFVAKFPEIKYSCLPRMTNKGNEIRFTLGGSPEDVEMGMKAFIDKLEEEGQVWERI